MKRFMPAVMSAVLLLCTMVPQLQAGTFEAMSTAGVYDTDGTTPLQGAATGGDLIQLIWTGPNGLPDSAGVAGGTTGDDSLLGTAYIGYGYPFEPDMGKFTAQWDHDLIALGANLFIRAWNDTGFVDGQFIYYGDSEVHTVAAVPFDSHDFRTFRVTEQRGTPVELAAFTASATPGIIEVRWTTQSETDNLGFDLFRSTSPHGDLSKLNEKMIEGAGNSQIRNDYYFEDRDIQDKTVYYYWLSDIAFDGAVTYHGPRSAMAVAKPEAYALDQNYPNPFNPSTSISYTLRDNGMVRLTIYNIRGQQVRNLVQQNQMAGQYSIEWDGRDDIGLIVPSGTYLYSLETEGFKATRRMTMAK